jgi:superoxide dismutase, Fe-Mn family
VFTLFPLPGLPANIYRPFNAKLFTDITMDKRTFLKKSAMLSAAGLVLPSLLSVQGAFAADNQQSAYSLPKLPYAANALEPHIDKRTMELHHGKHHQTYIDNLNAELKDNRPSLDQLMGQISRHSTKVRNNGGGHWNHSFFWQIMSPRGGGQPSGQLATAINNKFGSFDKMKEEFNQKAKDQFGSGWAWLNVNAQKELFISSTPNQDNPLMDIDGIERGTPILGLDVWEHAYYLKYQNKRPDYITAFWNVVNWQEVTKRYNQAMGGRN